MKDAPDHFGSTLFEDDAYRIIDCVACGFAHCLPIPEPEIMSELYANDYYASVKPEYIKEVGADADWHRLTFRARIKRLESFVTGRRMLEIGSGPGLFLAEAKARGWKEQGYEVAAQAWNYSTQVLGVNVINGELPERTKERYDAAYLGLVLEHIANPAALLCRVCDALAPGGAICVAVPNDFSVLQQQVTAQCHTPSWWVTPPHHINYFSFKSLDHLLRNCGFIPVRQEGTFPLELCCLLGLDYITEPALGKKAHALRKSVEFALVSCGLGDALHDVYATLALHGLGRECVIYAIKKRKNNIDC